MGIGGRFDGDVVHSATLMAWELPSVSTGNTDCKMISFHGGTASLYSVHALLVGVLQLKELT